MEKVRIGMTASTFSSQLIAKSPNHSAHELIVAAGSSTSLRHALQAEVEQTERLVFGMTRGEAEQILTSEGYLFPGSSISKAFLRVLSPKQTPPSHLIPGHESAVSRHDLIDDDGATLRLARAFLAYGVDPGYARRSTGKTALMLTPELACAGWEDAESLAVLLLRSGADVHATCNHDCTPLVYAFRSLQIFLPSCYPSYHQSANICARLAALISAASVAATNRSLRAHRELYRDPETRFDAVQARILSQEKNFVSRYDEFGGYEAFCEITERYLAILTQDMMNTGVDFDKLLPMQHLHYMTRILTSIGLDREAVGVQLECRTDVLKETMFMIQDHMRKILQRGW